jgi:CBS domain-containing protein
VATKMRDIMSYAPVCLAATEPVWAAATAMRDHGIGAVLVIRRGKLSGLVTDRDIAVRVLAENRNPLSTQVGDMASAGLAVLGPDAGVEQAARLFRERAVRRIPVVQDGRPVGMISFGDLARERRAADRTARPWPPNPA